MNISAFKVVLNGRDNRELIKNDYSDLTIAVYHLENEPFYERAGYPAFYGDDHGDYLAFEVRKRGQDVEPSEAIKWYAHHKLDYPQMELLMEDPRIRPLLN